MFECGCGCSTLEASVLVSFERKLCLIRPAWQQSAPATALQAAIYGALAGHLGAVLPACSSWEDATWALCRCWLEATLDSRLAQVLELAPSLLQVAQQRNED